MQIYSGNLVVSVDTSTSTLRTSAGATITGGLTAVSGATITGGVNVRSGGTTITHS
jgi:hypothetical protein